MKFEYELSNTQVEKLDTWKEAIKTIYGKYGLFTYSFTNNGIGLEVTVFSDLAKTEIDLTEVENW